MIRYFDAIGFLFVVNILLFPPLILFGYLFIKLLQEFSKPVSARFERMTMRDAGPPTLDQVDKVGMPAAAKPESQTLEETRRKRAA